MKSKSFLAYVNDDSVPKESEKDTEKYLVSVIESLGGLCRKWVCPNVRGVQDRLCFLPEAHFFLVEVKSEGEPLRTNQKRRAKELVDLGFRSYKADRKSEVDRIVKLELKLHNQKGN